MWVDAVVQSSANLPFTQYLPGITATLALLMITAVRRDEMVAVDPFDEGVFCRSRFWLLAAYGVSGAAVVSAVVVMLHQYALPESGEQERLSGQGAGPLAESQTRHTAAKGFRFGRLLDFCIQRKFP